MFKGLLPAMVTLFDEHSEVDLRATEAVVERLIDAGVDGIVALKCSIQMPPTHRRSGNSPR